MYLLITLQSSGLMAGLASRSLALILAFGMRSLSIALWVDQLVLPEVVVDEPFDDCDFFVPRQLAGFVPIYAVLVECLGCDLSC